MKQTILNNHLFHCEFYALKDGWAVYQNVWTADRLIAKNYRLQGWQASNGVRIASKNSPAWVGNTLYLEGGFPNFARKPVLIELPEETAYSNWLRRRAAGRCSIWNSKTCTSMKARRGRA